ncbi:class I adenylate-forming enzyme family protein, partial [Gordonibacter sp.]|uniref:class I adenylate-forming enzyme family protein n=1 Tax=Gordonibacter sp. TaxID=1968902 RepID=UPI002FCAE73C
MNLSDCFDSAADSCGDKTALVFRGRKTSYRELHRRVRALSAALGASGLRKGDRIAIVSPNSDKYLEISLAASRCGIVLENYSYRAGEELLFALIEASKPRLLFAHSEEFAPASLRSRIGAFTDTVLLYESGGADSPAYERFALGAGEDHVADPGDDDDVAAVLYTSGTTSMPKAVLLTNKNIISQTIANGLETGWKREDVYCQGQPLFHVAAFGAYCTLILGGTLVIVDSFDLEGLFQAIEENAVTRIGLTPQLIQMLSRLEGTERRSIESLDAIVYSGSSMSYDILVEANRKLACDLYGLYGMTETASIVCILHPEEHRTIVDGPDRSLIPVGRATVGTQIRIGDEYGEGIGELVVKNDGVMAGYADEGNTREVLCDGWYATGDIGYQDEGLYYLVSRKNNMIISGGENIFPLEIENCIRSIGPAVEDVVVLGVPSEVWGEAVHAVVEVAPGADLTPDTVRVQCAQKLSSYKKPKEIWMWEELPRTASGKVDRVKTLEAILATKGNFSIEEP